MLRQYARGKYALEVGSYDGGSAIEIAENCDNVICVDSFDNTGGDGITPSLENFLDNTNAIPNILLFKAYSEILFLFQSSSFDFIYIDGSHKEPYVSMDITNAQRLLKYDGRLAIHDIGRYPELDRVVESTKVWFPYRVQRESLLIMSKVVL